jgi:predicted GIY-YIG superfamily endonuclease
MKNKEHSELQKELNEIISDINYYLDECKSTKKLLGNLYNKSYKNPDNAGLKRHKQKKLCDLLYYRNILLSLQQQAITIKQQIKQTQRANNKAFIEYNNNKQKERLQAMNIDIQDNNKTKVVTLKQIIDSKQ